MSEEAATLLGSRAAEGRVVTAAGMVQEEVLELSVLVQLKGALEGSAVFLVVVASAAQAWLLPVDAATGRFLTTVISFFERVVARGG